MSLVLDSCMSACVGSGATYHSQDRWLLGVRPFCAPRGQPGALARPREGSRGFTLRGRGWAEQQQDMAGAKAAFPRTGMHRAA